MVPDKFDMVDMGGIDLILMQGEEVPGLYNRLVESITHCRYQCLYNWLFDGVIIPPAYVELEVNENEEVAINEGVTVSPDDVIHIYSLSPGPVEPEIVPLLAEENGEYTVPAGVDGFNPVTVDVPSYTPVINPITITENGTYNPSSGVDGYAPVTVNITQSVTPVTPDYQGLNYSFIALDGDFYHSNEGLIYYISCYPVEANKQYCLFVGPVESDRNRCAFYAGKTIDDFIQYIENPAVSEAVIYHPSVVISPTFPEPASNIRYMFKPSNDGEILIVTSRASVAAMPYCLIL